MVNIFTNSMAIIFHDQRDQCDTLTFLPKQRTTKKNEMQVHSLMIDKRINYKYSTHFK